MAPAPPRFEPVQLLRLDFERQPIGLEQLDAHEPGARIRRSASYRPRDVRTSIVPDGMTCPSIDTLVEVQARTVIGRDVEVGADRFLGKHDAGFVFKQRHGVRRGRQNADTARGSAPQSRISCASRCSRALAGCRLTTSLSARPIIKPP